METNEQNTNTNANVLQIWSCNEVFVLPDSLNGTAPINNRLTLVLGSLHHIYFRLASKSSSTFLKKISPILPMIIMDRCLTPTYLPLTIT